MCLQESCGQVGRLESFQSSGFVRDVSKCALLNIKWFDFGKIGCFL